MQNRVLLIDAYCIYLTVVEVALTIIDVISIIIILISAIWFCCKKGKEKSDE